MTARTASTVIDDILAGTRPALPCANVSAAGTRQERARELIHPLWRTPEARPVAKWRSRFEMPTGRLATNFRMLTEDERSEDDPDEG
ncbi:hypothetical protein [Agromyces sp. NPDC058064]|uniref:hypothetical protein n=1 Tax=Agromyces sp. NPDC058064 TaxID=3346322 RepID=UPI0036D8562F